MSVPAPTPLLGDLGQVSLRARDLPRAVRFYRDTLGVPLLFEGPGLALFQSGKVRLILSVPEAPEYDHPGSILYFEVTGIDRVHEALRAAGVTIVAEPHVIHRAGERALWMCFFKDSEENTLAGMEWR